MDPVNIIVVVVLLLNLYNGRKLAMLAKGITKMNASIQALVDQVAKNVVAEGTAGAKIVDLKAQVAALQAQLTSAQADLAAAVDTAAVDAATAAAIAAQTDLDAK